jgi:hypothetical protein
MRVQLCRLIYNFQAILRQQNIFQNLGYLQRMILLQDDLKLRNWGFYLEAGLLNTGHGFLHSKSLFSYNSFQMFANLLTIAETKNGLILPNPPIGSIPISTAGLTSIQIAGSAAATIGNMIPGAVGEGSLFGPYSGVNIAILTQRPGFYLWIAAICSFERAERFHAVQKVFFNSNLIESLMKKMVKFFYLSIQTYKVFNII